MKIFVCCSANNTIKDEYLNDCQNALKYVLQDNDLVFGAYNKGLMSVCYDIANYNNRSVSGVCPKVYENDFKELKCDNKIITDDIIDRTKKLINISDAIIILPGGFGTLNELITSIDSKRCEEINKPIIIYNSYGYYDKLFEFFDKIYKEKFSEYNIKDCYHISNSIEDTINYLNK